MNKTEEKSLEIEDVSNDIVTNEDAFEDTTLDVVPPSTLLEDNRKTRTKSVGRPPTGHFRKDTILQSSSTVGVNNNTTNMDVEPNPEKDVKIRQYKNIQVVASRTSSELHSLNWKNVSLKKTTTSMKQHRVNDGTPPWLKEVLERKNNLLSVKDNEFLGKTERERFPVLEINVSKTSNKVTERRADEDNLITKKDISVPVVAVTEKKPIRSPRRHTVDANFDDLFKNDNSADTTSTNNQNTWESLDIKVKDLITQFKNIQKNMQLDLQRLELSINEEFKKQIEELDEIRRTLLENRKLT